jgi:hypothetical protein
MEGRSFFISQLGYIGFGPRNTKSGDIIAVLKRAQTPFVLRKEGKGEYRLIGECYVHGIMHGEAWDVEGLRPRELRIH